MALRKPSDFFREETQENDTIEELVKRPELQSFSEAFNVYKDSLSKFNNLTDTIKCVEDIKSEIQDFIKKEDLDNSMMAYTFLLEESITKLKSDVNRIDKKKFISISNDVAGLADKINNFVEEELPKYKESIDKELDNVDEYKNIIDEKVTELGLEVIRNESHLKENNKTIGNIQKKVYDTIKRLNLDELENQNKSLSDKINHLEEIFEKLDERDLLNESLITEPPETNNSDPLTPLDQNFVTLDQLQEHYRLFVNRVQQQLSTIGGGGETQLKYLDDIVGIATNASAYDGGYLRYDHEIGKFTFGDAGGSESWKQGIDGPYVLSGVGIGTTISDSGAYPDNKLVVEGNARVTGILKIGTDSITLDAQQGSIKAGNVEVVSAGGGANFTGIVTAAGADFNGPVSIAGTLTYEDVVNVDSVGLVTARSGVRITDGGLVVSSGVSTVGVVTGGTYYGDGQYLTGIVAGKWDATDVGINTSSKVGIGTTNPQADLQVGTAITMYGNTGIISATTFTGNLDGTAGTATSLATARNIGGVSFDGTSNIDLPGVNSEGDQNTTGTAAGLSNSPNIDVSNIVGTALSISGISSVGAAITMYGTTGIVSATKFYGDGSGLENTGASLDDVSGTERLVLSDLTTGTMVSAATTSDLTFNSTDDTFHIGSGVTMYASTGIVSATSFYGSLKGNADTATVASGIVGDPFISVSNIVGTALSISGIATVTDTLKVGTSITAHAGIITATTFKGALDGNATSADSATNASGLTGNPNITVGTIVGTALSISSGITTVGFATATDVWVSGAVTATKFDAGGTSNQFLKADGSFDNTSYAGSDNIVGVALSISGIGTIGDTLKVGTAITAHAGIITATKFDAGGTSTEFLKADGSVDNSTYLTSYTETSTLNDVLGRGNASGIGISVGISTLGNVSDGFVKLYHGSNLVFQTVGTGVSIANAGLNTATIFGPQEVVIDPSPIGVGTTSGIVRIKGDLYVDGTEFIVNSENITLGDFVVGIASTVTTDALTDGAGIGIGSIGHEKTFKYHHSSASLKSSENLNIASGKGYQIAETEVLNATTLGSGVLNSSLTSVGTLGSLNVTGLSSVGTAITMYGTTGIVSATSFYGSLKGNADSSTTATNASGLTGNPNIIVGTVVGTALSISGIATVTDTLKVGTAITAHAGIITATTFKGALDGNATSADSATNASGLTGSPDINVSNIVGTALSISGISSVGTAITMYGSTGIVSATTFKGALEGDVITAAQPNITSVGTLGSLTVTNNITANGNIVGDNATEITNIANVQGQSANKLKLLNVGYLGNNTTVYDNSFLHLSDQNVPAFGGGGNFSTLASVSGLNLVFDTNNNDNNGLVIGSGSTNTSLMTTHMVVTNVGDVGIGTTNPTGTAALTSNEKVLAVGVVTATSFYGDLKGTADNATNAANAAIAVHASGLTGTPNITVSNIVGTALSISGIATVTDTLKVGTAITAHAGVVTATTFDASNYYMASILTRDKYRFWGNTQWTMGMTNGMTFGGLDSYAITSQVTNHDNRGWVFLDTNHTDAQGAMSLNTIGELVVAKSIRAGGGESDTSAPRQPLDIIGDGIISGDVGIGTTNPTGTAALTGNEKVLAVGVVTANTLYGSGANLTGLTGASANTYGDASNVAQITVDANGKISGITNVSISGGGGSTGAGGTWATNATGINTSKNVAIGTITASNATLTVDVGTASTAVVVQGSQGRLFSVTNSLSSGSIFSVNDISGIPSIDVDADGTIQLAPHGSTENVGLGTTNPTSKLHVVGGANITGVLTTGHIADSNGTIGAASSVLSSTGSGLSWVAQSGGGGISLSDLSVGSEGTASGDGALGYDNSTGVFTYTPPLTVINATNVTITDDTSGSGTHYLHFGSATSSNDGVEVDSTGLVYKDGKIGIGTNAPTFTTEIVSGDDNNTGANTNNPSDLSVTGPNKTLVGGGANVFINSNTAHAVDTGGSLGFSGRNTNSSPNSVLWGTIKGAKENATTGNTAGYLAFGVANHSAGAIVETLRITSTGDVGIGTNNPTGTAALTGNTKVLAVGIATANTVYGKLNNLTYPTTNGTDGWVLTSDGAGLVQWEEAPGAGGGISGITIKEDGTQLTTLATTLNFVGSNVTASGTGAEKTITITGGSGGGVSTGKAIAMAMIFG